MILSYQFIVLARFLLVSTCIQLTTSCSSPALITFPPMAKDAVSKLTAWDQSPWLP